LSFSAQHTEYLDFSGQGQSRRMGAPVDRPRLGLWQELPAMPRACLDICSIRGAGLVLILALSAAGCSSGDRVGIEGRVTYEGEPLSQGSITFLPESDKGVKSGAPIVNGEYQVEQKFGPMPGPHRVEIHWAKGTGQKFKNEFGELLEIRKEGLPDRYHTKSTLNAVLKRGDNVVDFDLKK
jgi:hypothetical protein